MPYKVEQDWEIFDYRCVVIMSEMGHRCGYVGVNENHPFFNLQYDEELPIKFRTLWEKIKGMPIGKRGAIDILCCIGNKPKVGILFNVHGGITYSSKKTPDDYPVKSDLWWFGFDCAHYGDAKDLSVVSESIKEIELTFMTGGVVRSLEYCIAECGNLAIQLKDIENEFEKR